MNLLKSLQFSLITTTLKEYCKTSGAKQLVDNISFSGDYQQVERLLKEVYQMRGLLMGIKQFPDSGYIDMRQVLLELKVKDTCIDIHQMPLLLDSLTCIKDILRFFEDIDEKQITYLRPLIENVYFDENILTSCNAIIDEQGNIRPSCSPILREIYSKRQSKSKQIERQINQILNYSKKEGWTNDEDEISIRNDTLVIPVKSTYKRNIKGILHDTSQTGQTFYIEPEEIVSLNFEIKELFFEEQREIHRILLEFSDLLRENLDSLLLLYDMLVRVDFIKAKALYALETNATMPQLSPKPHILWYAARHPLLESALKKKGKQITPLNIELNDKQRILVISGSNAGGKSICLKTVALLQYMLQCGLLVPMKEVSEMGIFDQIFLSIGDEQSLSDDLSTYSSHLRNMSEICDKADKDTLFLIDEFGSGTDPSLGGAIAESILEYLNTAKAFGVITTHYSSLKHLALEKEGIVNAAMLFDTNKMQPLYTLSIGTPGSSFTFEIAKKSGLSNSIIDNAKKRVGKQSMRMEENLQQIAVNKLESEKYLRSAKQYDDILYQTVNKYEQEIAKLNAQKHDILSTARSQAKQILASANKQIEHTIMEIKTSKAEKETVKTLRQDITNSINQIEKDIQEDNSKIDANTLQETTEKKINDNPKLKKQNIKIVTTPIQIDDYVIFPQTEAIGKVVSIDKNRFQIDMGSVRVQTTKKSILKIDKASYLKQLRDNRKNQDNSFNQINIKTMFDLNDKRQKFNEKLDLRGYRGDEAIMELERFLDNARMLGEKHLRILHGKGDGILKTLVRNYLRSQKDVITCQAEDIRFGGEGITVVELE